MNIRLLSGACLSVLAGAVTVAPGGAAAQTAPAATAPAEVVVTAQKRAQNLQDVPQAIQAVSGAQLRSQGAVEFTDLSKIAPSLVIRPAEQPVNSSVSIRGVGTFAFSIGVEPDVAIIVDDVPVAFEARAFADLNDIQRIEVARGPQSTLYGKSASAGLINIVTPAPSTNGVTGRLNAMATTDSEYQIGGAVSGPISDTLAYRLSANYDDFDGNVKNLYDGDKVNGRKLGSVYGKLQWTPNSKFQATLAGNYVHGDTTIGRPFINLAPNANLRGVATLPPSVWAPGVTAGPDNADVSNNFTSGNRYDAVGESLKMSYDLNFATLVSVTSHDFYFLKDRLDVDEGSAPAIDNRQPDGRFTYEQYTQELRLVSPSTERLRYTLGLFYADDQYSRRFTRGPVFSLANWYATSGSDQYAGFGQLDYDLMPGTTATLGGRVQREKVDYTFHDFLAAAPAPNNFAGSASETFGTYKAALEHKFSGNAMVYASYATGHKGQTYDLTTGFNNNRALAGPIKPEKSATYEIGTRLQFFERRLTVNLTAFDATYRDFQAQGIEVLPDGTTNFRLANVGRLHNRGVELDSNAYLGDWTLGLNAAYLDAKITDFPKAQCYPLEQLTVPTCGAPYSPTYQNLAGATPPQSPKVKFNATADYHHPLASTPFIGVFQAAYSYQSKFNFSLSQDPQTIQKSYGILNLSIGVRNPTQHYEVMLFVNNALDKTYYADMFNSTATYGSQAATQVLPPRDYRRYGGIRFAYNF
jgi:iron complex outermembrane receptor protein